MKERRYLLFLRSGQIEDLSERGNTLRTTLTRRRVLAAVIATLGFGQIVSITALNGDKLLRALTGDPQLAVFNGAEGITLTYAAPRIIFGLPETTWPLVAYVLALVYFLATLQRSRFGRLLSAIRLDETAAATLCTWSLR